MDSTRQIGRASMEVRDGRDAPVKRPRRMLPPLEVGETYRTREFQSLEFETQSYHRQLTGEDAAILHLHLGNSTTLEIQISDEDLRHHMVLLMEAFPAEAIARLRLRWPKEFEK